jgi:alpha-beta hydrolase superfamily lysophospholipase
MRAPIASPTLTQWILRDGYPLAGRVWTPTRARPAAAIIYLHGIQSHGGWYEWSASVLAQSGLPVLMPDRRGSGLNRQARGDIDSVDQWLDDLDELAEWAVERYGVSRFAVVGVSWGGKLAVAWSARDELDVSHILLVAPGLFPAVPFGPLRRVSVGYWLLRNPERPCPIPLDDPALFTSNPAGQQFIAHDPLKLMNVTARFLYHSARLDRRLTHMPTAAVTSHCSLLLADRDRIIRNEPTLHWLQRLCREEPRVVRFDGAAHTLEFEGNVERYGRELETFARDAGPGAVAQVPMTAPPRG